jgi:hypothetical protein
MDGWKDGKQAGRVVDRCQLKGNKNRRNKDKTQAI